MIDEKKLIEVLKATYENYDLRYAPIDAQNVAMAIEDETIKMIEEQPKISGWIPCSERLPEEYQSVIACFAHGTVTELRFYKGIFHGICDYNERVIVAWQPLPEPYKEAEGRSINE